MARIERHIEIGRPPAEVFALLTDLDRLPEWATIVVGTRDVSEFPLREGRTFRQTLRVLGRDVESDWRVTELQVPRRVAYEAAAPGGGTLTMRQTSYQATAAAESSSSSTTSCRAAGSASFSTADWSRSRTSARPSSRWSG
jgi:uncharacterized protein YndB with AHSA1/START domain